MPDFITRQNAEVLIQEQLISTIFQDLPKASVFMTLARKLPNMPSSKTRMKVLDFLPLAYWVNGDTGFKQTSKQAWDNVYMNAEELAVIVPIPEAVLDDADTDIIGEVTPRAWEAMGMRVDEATIFDVNRPSTWDAGIITRARQAGNNVASGADLYEKLLCENGVIAKVEQSGRMVTGAIADMSMRAKLRGIRSDDGKPIFKTDMQGPTQYALDGAPMYFPENGAFQSNVAQLIVGDFNQAVYAVRKDVTVKILDQGVIQDPATKEIVYNLAQQDMIAIRVVFRMGWAMPNPATRLDADRVTCPFAYLEPASAATTYTATFTISDNDGALEGAIVSVSGARLKTNASGQAVFNLRPGAYKYKVKKDGYVETAGSITVSDVAVTQAVTLAAQA